MCNAIISSRTEIKINFYLFLTDPLVQTCREYCCHVQMRLDLFNSKIDRLIAQPPLVFVVVAYETFLALPRTVLNYFCTMSGLLYPT